MKTFTHKPTQVEAIQVGKPYLNITRAYPFSRKITGADGHRFKYFLFSKPGEPSKMAHEGDWVIKHPNAEVEILKPEEFDEQYVEGTAYALVGTGAIAPRPTPYPPNTTCACGELIHPDMPEVGVEADGILWHGNVDGGGHRADVHTDE